MVSGRWSIDRPDCGGVPEFAGETPQGCGGADRFAKVAHLHRQLLDVLGLFLAYGLRCPGHSDHDFLWLGVFLQHDGIGAPKRGARHGILPTAKWSEGFLVCEG